RYRESARIDLRRGSAERLQFDNDAFDKAVVIKRWRSTRCKSGRMPWPGCEKFGGSQDPAAGSPSVLLRIRAAERRLEGDTHGRWLHSGERQGLLRSGDEPVTV